MWLDTGLGRRDFKPRELLLRAVPPVQVSRVSVLMHATGFESPCSLNVSSYHADIRGFMQVAGLEYCPNYGVYHCIVSNCVIDHISRVKDQCIRSTCSVYHMSMALTD